MSSRSHLKHTRTDLQDEGNEHNAGDRNPEGEDVVDGSLPTGLNQAENRSAVGTADQKGKIVDNYKEALSAGSCDEEYVSNGLEVLGSPEAEIKVADDSGCKKDLEPAHDALSDNRNTKSKSTKSHARSGIANDEQQFESTISEKAFNNLEDSQSGVQMSDSSEEEHEKSTIAEPAAYLHEDHDTDEITENKTKPHQTEPKTTTRKRRFKTHEATLDDLNDDGNNGDTNFENTEMESNEVTKKKLLQQIVEGAGRRRQGSIQETTSQQEPEVQQQADQTTDSAVVDISILTDEGAQDGDVDNNRLPTRRKLLSKAAERMVTQIIRFNKQRLNTINIMREDEVKDKPSDDFITPGNQDSSQHGNDGFSPPGSASNLDLSLDHSAGPGSGQYSTTATVRDSGKSSPENSEIHSGHSTDGTSCHDIEIHVPIKRSTCCDTPKISCKFTFQ